MTSGIPGGYRRPKLPYPYSYTTREIFPVDVIVTDEPPQPIRNDCNLVILQLTDQQLFQYTSAMMAGLDLIYPNEWQTLYEQWAWAQQLANTGNFVSCEGDQILSICEIIADCIRNDSDVQQAINEVIDLANPDLPPEPSPLPALDNGLDCVWGASVDTYELVLDAWGTIKTIIDQGKAIADTVTDLGGTFPYLTPNQLEVIELLLDLGTAALDAYLNQQSTQDNWACTLFNCIVAGGQEYMITRDCIDEAMSIFAPPPPFDIVDLGDFLIAASSYNTFRSFWQRRSDDSCNNDWRTVCGLTCGDPLDDLESFADPRIVEITTDGAFLQQSSTQYDVSASGTYIELRFDTVYCFTRVAFQRRSSFTQPGQNSYILDTTYGVTEPDSVLGPDDNGRVFNGTFITDRIRIAADNSATLNNVKRFIISPGANVDTHWELSSVT